jgi:peptidyl-prolyl cis-trans isomerase B (cyclophilin B)
VAGKDRKKELARQRYERQVQRRAAKRARTRKIKVIVGAFVAVALLGTTAWATGLTPVPGDKGRPKAAATNTPKPTPQPSVSAKPGECAYQPLDLTQVPPQAIQQMQQATRDVGTPPKKPDRTGAFTETIKTNLGDIVIKLDAAKAPCTVNSFKYLADKNFFDKSTCHRLVTKGLHVLQCGDPSGTGMGGPRYRFGNENLPKADGGDPAKPVTYPAGTVAMANSGPDSNGSQFFMVYDDSELPPNYTKFGTLVEGSDILEKVADAGTESEDPQAGGGPPKEKVEIEDITITKG